MFARAIVIALNAILLTLAAAGGSLAEGSEVQNAPAWVTAIEPGHWQAISLNTLSDVDPEDDPEANPNYPNSAPWSGNTGQAGVIVAWNGGAYARDYGTHGSLILFGGGHADYFGSEVYAFDLSSREWKRLTNPYPGPMNWPYETAEYPDRSAIPPHTYDYVDWHPQTNSFVVLKGNKKLGGAHITAEIPHLFDLASKEWRRGPEMQGVVLNPGGYSIYDSKRDVFWLHGGSGSSGLAKYEPYSQNADGTYGSWTTYPKQLDITDSVAEYDPINDLMLIQPYRSASRIAAIDLKSPESQYIWLNEAGDIPAKVGASGWSWSESRAAVIYHPGNGSDDVYGLKHTDGSWSDGTWTWKSLTSPDNNVVPSPAPSNGIRSRFQVVTYSDAEVAVVVNGVEAAVYAFRIPAGIRPNAPTNLQVSEAN